MFNNTKLKSIIIYRLNQPVSISPLRRFITGAHICYTSPRKRMNSLAKAKETTKSQLISTALDLFKRKGYDNVTIDDICRDVGITRGAFYYHFNSKEELLSDFHSIPESISMERLSSIFEAENFWDQLWLCYSFYLDYTQEMGPEIVSQILRINLAKDLRTYRIVESSAKIAYSIIEKGQAAGQIRNKTDPTALYFIGVQTIMGYELQWAIQNGAFDKIAAMRGALEVLFDVEPPLRKGGNPVF